MTHQPSPGSWLALHRELFATALDPSTLRQVGRHLLLIGALIDAAPFVLQFAEAMKLATIAVRVQAADSLRVCVELVDVVDLRSALGI